MSHFDAALYAIGMKRKFIFYFYALTVGLLVLIIFPQIAKIWIIPFYICLILIGGRIQVKTIDDHWNVDTDTLHRAISGDTDWDG